VKPSPNQTNGTEKTEEMRRAVQVVNRRGKVLVVCAMASMRKIVRGNLFVPLLNYLTEARWWVDFGAGFTDPNRENPGVLYYGKKARSVLYEYANEVLSEFGQETVEFDSEEAKT